MSPATRRPSRRVQGYVALTTAIAILGSWLTYHRTGGPSDLVALFVLTGLGSVGMVLGRSSLGRQVDLSFLSIILLASLPAVGPFGAAVVAAVPYLVEPVRSRPLQRVFNAAMGANLGWLGGSVYQLTGGRTDLVSLDPRQLLLSVALPLLLADIVQMVANAVLVAGVVQADTGQPARTTFVGMVSTSGAAYLGYGVIGLLLVVLWYPAQVGPISAVLVLPPLLVARWVIAQYAEEVRSHESALSGLVTAAELKDPQSAGHAQRVALLSERMAEVLTLPAPQANALRFAALLHDVGKVGLPTRLVRDGIDWDEEDLAVLATHAERGARLLEDIAFLEPSLEGVRHHHERWDGLGFPAGLKGDDIPLLSRIIAVADAFESLTSGRSGTPYPAQVALGVLRERAGTHLDPALVPVLAEALQRHGWPEPEEVTVPNGYIDHDDPQVSDRIARLRRLTDGADAGRPPHLAGGAEGTSPLAPSGHQRSPS